MANTLYIGTRRYSSWSLRGWLAVRLAGLEVDEVVIPLAGGTTTAIEALNPGGTVPYLEHDGNRIWDSLAICEYCAEIAPALWPLDRAARTHARVIAAEMHAGFRALRQAMPMSLFRQPPASTEAGEEVARIEEIWRDTRDRFGAGGAFLFGAAFGNADAMYAPVVARFLTYRPALSAGSRAYCDAVRAHPLVGAWYEAAAGEPAEWRLAQYEA